MESIKTFIKTEPIRTYEIVAAVVALVALLVPGVPVAAILAVFIPLLGVGEHVRSRVTPVTPVKRTYPELHYD